MIKLFLEEIQDEFVRENFQHLANFINEFPFEKGAFKFFKIDIPTAVTNYQYPHNLGYLPKDVIQTYSLNPVTITWNYDKFTNTFLDITTSGATSIRAFIGRYEELTV